MELSAGFVQFPGGSEWIIIFLVILLIFGPKSLPKVGHAIGRGIREFKDASDGISRAIEEEVAAAEHEESDPLSPDEDETDETGETTEEDSEHTD